MHCHTWASSKYEWVVGSRREYLDQQDELSCPVTFLLQYVAVCADLPQLHRSSSKSSREDLEDILNPKRCLLQVMHGLQHVSEAKDTHQLESSSSSSSSSSRSFPASEPISCAMTRTAIDDLHKSVLQTSTREWRNPIEVLMDKLRQPGGRRGLSTEYFRHLRELGSLQNSLHNRATGDPSLSTFLGRAVESSRLMHCKRGGAGRARNNKRHSSGSDNHPSKLQKSGTSRYLGSSSSNAHAASHLDLGEMIAMMMTTATATLKSRTMKMHTCSFPGTLQQRLKQQQSSLKGPSMKMQMAARYRSNHC
jgi:hypothetical protein